MMNVFKKFVFSTVMQRAILVLIVISTAFVSVAFAQNAHNCGPRELVIERLATSYSETRRSMGLGANNSVVEVFASDTTGTWTITVTAPNGTTCLVASGQAYERFDEALPAPGNDL